MSKGDIIFDRSTALIEIESQGVGGEERDLFSFLNERLQLP
jgi:hypothetical protein